MIVIYNDSCFRRKFGENQNKHFVLQQFFFLENFDFYKIILKNIAKPYRPQMTIWRVRIACWITKATDTHSEYGIFNAFSTATMAARSLLNITLYVHCLSYFINQL
jgi:hypothetical protein